MYHGDFNLGTLDHPKIVLGVGIESAIGVQADRNLMPVTVFLPKKSNSNNPLAALSEGNTTTSGSFAIQQDFDNKYVITNLAFMKQQMNYRPNEFSALEVSLLNPDQSEKFTHTLQKEL
jgi:lipoprotein-releasing system permease protein